MPSLTSLSAAAEWMPVALVCALLVLALPLLVIVYYWLRLAIRRENLRLRLIEADQADEYLRLFHYAEWEALDGETNLVPTFNRLFTQRFRGDNSLRNYLLPFLLTLTSAVLFSTIILRSWLRLALPVDEKAILFAIAGALLYVYPQFVRRFASLSLNPQAILELMGQLWLAVLIGVVAATASNDALKPLVAFVGSLVPIPMVQHLRRRADATPHPDDSDVGHQMLLEITGGDRDLVAQLNYIGVRSLVQLAYESPLRLFVETDPSLLVCTHLVDRAILYLYVPDAPTRDHLNRLGVKTAADLVTQAYLDLPPRNNPAGPLGRRFLGPDEPLPPYLEEPLAAIASALQIGTVGNVRNLLAMMKEDPQVAYLQYFWTVQNTVMDKFMALEVETEDSE